MISLKQKKQKKKPLIMHFLLLVRQSHQNDELDKRTEKNYLHSIREEEFAHSARVDQQFLYSGH